MALKKILTLGKEALDKLGDTKLTDKLKKDFLKTGGKKKKVTKVVKKTDTPVKKLASDAKTKRNIKSKIDKAKNLAKKQKKTKKPIAAITSIVGKTVYNKPAGPFPKVYKKPIGPKPKSFFQKHKKKIIGGGALSLLPFAIGTDKNVGEGSISDGGNKNKKPPKDFNPKIKKPTVPEVKIKKSPKVKSNDYTGRFIDKKGDVAYDSFSDFIAHMTGKPKKRKMPKKTARIIGTGDKLKRKDADTKGAGKGVKFKAFKSGTKDKTIGKPMFGGGFISSLYDKPEKTEKHKGNTTSARQVKGYGKAKRP